MLDYKEYPDGKFVEVKIEGKLTSSELEQMWTQLNDRIAEWGHVGVLKEVHDFPQVELSGIFENIQNGIKNYSKFDRVAIVTDKKWVKNVSDFFSKLTGMKTAVFHLNEKDQAKTWLKENQ